jgi:hypothetical protein
VRRLRVDELPATRARAGAVDARHLGYPERVRGLRQETTETSEGSGNAIVRRFSCVRLITVIAESMPACPSRIPPARTQLGLVLGMSWLPARARRRRPG